MTIDKGDRGERAARGMFVCALALACGACSGTEQSPAEQPSAGHTSAGGSAGYGGTRSSGGTTSSSGDSGGPAESGADGGKSSDGGAPSDGGQGGHGGTGHVAGTTGSGGTHSGGTSAGGTNAGGTSSGGSAGSGPSTCGNSVLEAAEECDDGNTLALDGCSASCKYEVVDRMTSITLQSANAPAFCTPTSNALGRAFSSAALTSVNSQLTQSIQSGALNNLLQFNGLDDPTGVSNDSSLSIGFLPAVPDPAKGSWPGGNPRDFWFLVPSASVDAQGASLSALTGSLTNRTVSAGPGSLKLPLAIGGSPSTLTVSNALMRATLNAPTDVPAPPPTSLAAGVKVFQAITGSLADQGICGNVTVDSLAHIPVPASLASGDTACMACTDSHTYTACSGNTVEAGCNSMLDVLVGGCKALGCALTLVTAVQPDVPASAGAAVTPLSLGSGSAVSSDLSNGNNDAYSSYFQFQAVRAHITGKQ